MGLMPELVSCVEEDYGWLLPTDIQDEAIPLILGIRYILICYNSYNEVKIFLFIRRRRCNGSGRDRKRKDGYLMPFPIMRENRHLPIILFIAAFALPLIQLMHERLKFLQEETVAEKSSSPRVKKEIFSINAQDKDSSFEFTPTTQGFSCKVKLWQPCSISPRSIAFHYNDQIKADDPTLANASSWFGARATHGVKSGSHYYECRVDSLSPQPTCRVGWSTIASHLELGKDEHGNRQTNRIYDSARI